MTYSMRRFQLLTRHDFLIASEYHLNGVWVFPINETGGRASGPLGRAIHRAGRKHGSDFARVISRWRELKSIPDTEKLMISRYQKMISRGIIPDILISANAVPLVNIYLSNSPISQRVFPSGGQLKHRKLAHDKQPTAGCIAIFHKYCCYTKCGDITTNLTLRNHWGYVTDVSKYPVTMRVNGAWIKRYCVLCSKTYNISHSCHNPAGSRQAARGACICETSLLGVLRQYTGTGHYRIGSVYIASWVIASWVVVTAELEIIASWDDRTSNC